MRSGQRLRRSVEMRRVDNVKRETLDYKEFYWWNLQERLDKDYEILREKDKADKGKR